MDYGEDLLCVGAELYAVGSINVGAAGDTVLVLFVGGKLYSQQDLHSALHIPLSRIIMKNGL
jgi:hypothetical protein